jgi:hypothetical protein
MKITLSNISTADLNWAMAEAERETKIEFGCTHCFFAGGVQILALDENDERIDCFTDWPDRMRIKDVKRLFEHPETVTVAFERDLRSFDPSDPIKHRHEYSELTGYTAEIIIHR